MQQTEATVRIRQSIRTYPDRVQAAASNSMSTLHVHVYRSRSTAATRWTYLHSASPAMITATPNPLTSVSRRSHHSIVSPPRVARSHTQIHQRRNCRRPAHLGKGCERGGNKGQHMRGRAAPHNRSHPAHSAHQGTKLQRYRMQPGPGPVALRAKTGSGGAPHSPSWRPAPHQSEL